MFSIIRFLIGILVYCYASLLPSPALANTDPSSATSSANATIPSFVVTSDQHAPTSPILLRPTDNAVTGDHRPELVWRESTDEDSNTVLYTVFINDTATYLGVSGAGSSGSTLYTARVEGGEIRLLPTTNLQDGIYTWRVDAYDLMGNTSHSATWHFTIDSTAPSLTLVDLDTYHYPVISEGSNFDIAGPKDVYFTVLSDPHSTIQITFVSNSTTLHLSTQTSDSGLASLYQHLDLGVYSTTILAIDRSGNTTFLPDFTLTITQSSLLLPGISPIPLPGLVHDLPASLIHLPATIAKLDTRSLLPYHLIILLALILLILLIILWRRRYNFILLDSKFRPIPQATVYHSIPNLKSGIYHLESSQRGRLYIPGLHRFSTLTVRLQDRELCTTHILSICARRRLYTIVL